MIDRALQDTTAGVGQKAVTPEQLDSLRVTLERTVTQLADSLGSAASQVSQAIDTPSLWDKGVSIAGIAVALLAIVEGWRLYKEGWETKKRAAARVSARAIPLRRNIKAWLDEIPPEFSQKIKGDNEWSNTDASVVFNRVKRWDELSTWDRIEKVQERIEKLNEEASLADKAITTKVHNVTAAFYLAFDLINPVAAIPHQKGLAGDLRDHFSQQHGFDLARADELLGECAKDLNSLIDEGFKEARKRLK